MSFLELWIGGNAGARIHLVPFRFKTIEHVFVLHILGCREADAEKIELDGIFFIRQNGIVHHFHQVVINAHPGDDGGRFTRVEAVFFFIIFDQAAIGAEPDIPAGIGTHGIGVVLGRKYAFVFAVGNKMGCSFLFAADAVLVTYPYIVVIVAIDRITIIGSEPVSDGVIVKFIPII